MINHQVFERAKSMRKLDSTRLDASARQKVAQFAQVGLCKTFSRVQRPRDWQILENEKQEDIFGLDFQQPFLGGSKGPMEMVMRSGEIRSRHPNAARPMDGVSVA